jgi:phosphoribosylformylglycinamidine synthase
VYEQYDSMVGTDNMSTNNFTDAAIVNIKDSKKALALTVDCNSRYVNADPEIGCSIAVAEAARNIVCSGGNASAVTNCLNFGNPYNPEVYWQFVGAIKGMGAACKKFDTPVTGGNVSFYNQYTEGNETKPVFPTPTIGMLGIVEDKSNITSVGFKNEGDSIYVIGKLVNDINSSEYLYSYHKVKNTPAPYFNLDEEFDMQQAVKKIILEKLVNSCHDCADGGLFVTLMESAFQRNLGFEITSEKSIRKDAFLFGESQGRVVVSLNPANEKQLEDLLKNLNVSAKKIGIVKGNNAIVDAESFGVILELKDIFENSITNKLTK